MTVAQHALGGGVFLPRGWQTNFTNLIQSRKNTVGIKCSLLMTIIYFVLVQWAMVYIIFISNVIQLISFSIITVCNIVAARLCFHRRLSFCSQGGCITACTGADTLSPQADTTPQTDTPPARHPG